MGRSTVESIQSGLYYGQLGMVKEMLRQIETLNLLPDGETVVIGTGGFSSLFESENVFDHIISDLCLKGLYHALKVNS